MKNYFKIYGNFHIYAEKLEGDRKLGIQKNNNCYTVFVADKEDTVEEILNLRSENDLNKVSQALELFKGGE